MSSFLPTGPFAMSGMALLNLALAANRHASAYLQEANWFNLVLTASGALLQKQETAPRRAAALQRAHRPHPSPVLPAARLAEVRLLVSGLLVSACLIATSLWAYSTWWLVLAVSAVGETFRRTRCAQESRPRAHRQPGSRRPVLNATRPRAAAAAARVPFNLGAWGAVFPVGVWTALTCLLAKVAHSLAFAVIGAAAVIAHVLLWLVVVALTAQRAWRGELFHAPCLAAAAAAAASASAAAAAAPGAGGGDPSDHAGRDALAKIEERLESPLGTRPRE